MFFVFNIFDDWYFFSVIEMFLFVFDGCFCSGISDGGCLFVSEIFNYEKYRVSKRYAVSSLYNTPSQGGALETEKERITTPSFFSFSPPL